MDARYQPAPLRLLPAPRPSLIRGLKAVEAGLWLFSLVALGLAGWMVGDAYLYQVRSQDLVPEPTAGQGELRRIESPRAPIDAGSPIARLAIPRLDLAVVVAEGTTSSVLRRAVGHLPASARPGERGNIVLAGHRDTFFRALADLRAGDDIVVDSAAGHHLYRVAWSKVVDPGAVEHVAASDYPALTLVTCYPFRYVGNAPLRFVARARWVAAGPAAVAAAGLASSPGPHLPKLHR